MKDILDKTECNLYDHLRLRARPDAHFECSLLKLIDNLISSLERMRTQDTVVKYWKHFNDTDPLAISLAHQKEVDDLKEERDGMAKILAIEDMATGYIGKILALETENRELIEKLEELTSECCMDNLESSPQTLEILDQLNIEGWCPKTIMQWMEKHR